MPRTLRLLRERVLVRELGQEEVTTSGGIVLPATRDPDGSGSHRECRRGIVVELGLGNRHHKTRVSLPWSVEPGTIILYRRGRVFEMAEMGRRWVGIRDEDIEAVECDDTGDPIVDADRLTEYRAEYQEG